MNTFKLEIFAYPIDSIDWRERKSFFFEAEKMDMEKHDNYFMVKVKSSDLPREHYLREDGAYGCRKAEESISRYATIEGDTYIFPWVQTVSFKGVWG